MADSAPQAPGFIAELGRRRVLRVVGFYAIAVWLIWQVADVILEPLNAPGWIMTALIIALALGFPIVAVLAWAFDITPTGLVRTGPPGDTDIAVEGLADLVSARPRVWADIVVITALVAIVTYLLMEPRVTLMEAEARTASIAVLPFINLSSDPDDAYLGDALAEDLIHHLTQFAGLRVAARTSSWAWSDRRAEIPRIAEALRVDNVLEGSVQREGDRVRVTVQLIKGHDGFHIWSRTFTTTIAGMLGIQQAVAREAAESLEVPVTDAEARRLRVPLTTNTRAYELYLRGLEYAQRPHSGVTSNTAVGLFERALEYDPRFAAAYAALCNSLLVRYASQKSSEDFAAAERACHRALTLDDGLVEARVALGQLLRHSGQYDRALELFSAILQREYRTGAQLGLAGVYAALGRDDVARVAYEEAITRDPGYWGAHYHYGYHLYYLGDYEGAAREFQWVVELTPDSATSHNALAAASFMRGDFETGLRAMERSRDIEPSVHNTAGTGLYRWYLQDFAGAASAYREALEMAPDHFYNWCRLGSALRLAGNTVEALESYTHGIELGRRTLAVNPSDIEGRHQLSLCYSGAGRSDDAIAEITETLELSPRAPISDVYAGVVYLEAGDRETGFRFLERALAQGFPPVLIELDPEIQPFLVDGGFRTVLERHSVLER